MPSNRTPDTDRLIPFAHFWLSRTESRELIWLKISLVFVFLVLLAMEIR